MTFLSLSPPQTQNYIINKNGSIIHQLDSSTIIYRLSDHRFIAFDSLSEQLQICNSNFEVLSKYPLAGKHEGLEVINENLVACVQDYNNICMYSTCDGHIKMIRKHLNVIVNAYPQIQRLGSDKFGTIYGIFIKIWDQYGTHLTDIFIPSFHPGSRIVDLTAGRAIVCTEAQIKIFCYESSRIVADVSDCSFVGVVPNGFLARSSHEADKFLLRWYDFEGNFLSGVLTDCISMLCPVKKIKRFSNDQYVFFFDKLSEHFDHAETPKIMNLAGILKNFSI